MAKFIDDTTTPVQVDGDPNIIHVRNGATQGELARILDQAAAQLAALVEGSNEHNARSMEIFMAAFFERWEGPDFDGQPISTATIARLNMADPLIVAAVAEMGKHLPQDTSGPKA